MGLDSNVSVGDCRPVVQLVTYETPPEPTVPPAPVAPEPTPTETAQEATVEQTGADPPPEA